MIDFSNLRQNFRHVLGYASLHEKEIMLRELAADLEPGFPVVGATLYAVANELADYRGAKHAAERSRHYFSCGDPECSRLHAQSGAHLSDIGDSGAAPGA